MDNHRAVHPIVGDGSIVLLSVCRAAPLQATTVGSARTFSPPAKKFMDVSCMPMGLCLLLLHDGLLPLLTPVAAIS